MRSLPLRLVLGSALAFAACGGDDSDPTPADAGTDAIDATSDTADAAVDTATGTDTTRPDVAPADPPTIASIAPDTGPTAGAQEVTVRGTNFLAPCNVVFGITDALASRNVNDTTLAVVTPEVDEPGPVDVRVSCRNGDVTLSDGYTFVGPEEFVIDRVEPAFGRTSGGDTVTLTGSGLVGGTRNLVAFGGQPATDVTFVDDTTITCVTRAGTAGLVSLTVELDGDVRRVADAFTYVDPLVVDRLEPAFGDIAGGTRITFTGAGFAEGTALSVAFGGIEADGTAFAYGEDGDTLTVTTPASDGTEESVVDVVVSTAIDTVTLEGAFAWIYPASISAMTPGSMLSAGGQRFVLDGAGFREDADPLTVLIGETEAFDVTWESETQLSFLAPALDPGVYDVTLAHGLQTLMAPIPLRVVAPLRIDTVTPSEGDAAGGDRITIEGAGFAEGVLVFFGGTAGTELEIENEGRLRITSPAGSGTVSVELRNPPASASAPDAFTYR